MPRIKCPTCAVALDVTDAMLGQQVHCGSCQAVFVASAGRPSRRDDEDDRPSRRTRREEDEDERPSRRSRRRDEDEDEDEEEDDFDEAPRRRQRSKGANGMATAAMVLGIIAVVIEVPALLTSLSGAIGGACCCCLAPFSLITWIPHAVGGIVGGIGLTLGVVAQKQGGRKGQANAGVIMSGLAVVAALLGIVLSILGIAVPIAAQPNPNNQFNNPPFNQPNPNPPPFKRR